MLKVIFLELIRYKALIKNSKYLCCKSEKCSDEEKRNGKKIKNLKLIKKN
jgi:hypothetical protein